MPRFNKYDIGEYLYSRLPSYHKEADEKYDLILKRYLEVLNEGFKLNMQDLDNVLARVQASKCPQENLKYIAYSMGADWISTIHPKYQRQIIAMLIKLYKQKGTIDALRFIASELSGFEAKIIEGEIPDEYMQPGDENRRLLTIKLQAPEIDDPVQSQQHEQTITEVLKQFTPVQTKFILVITYFYDEVFESNFTSEDILNLVQDLGAESLEISSISDVEISKVVLNYIQEDVKINELGIDTYVMCTNKPKCRLTSREGRLTTLAYVDMLYVNGELTHIYE